MRRSMSGRGVRVAAVAVMVLAGAGGAGAQTQEFQKPDPDKWYRLDTRYNGTDARVGRCIQYYPAGSEHPDMLWSAVPVAASDPAADYQWWRFVENPDSPGQYAMICKAAPSGYVNPEPTSISNSGRWVYVTDGGSAGNTGKYGFIFVTSDTLSGVDAATGESYCAIATERSQHWYMNCGAAAQDYAINLWYETYSEDANEWLFNYMGDVDGGGPTPVADVSADRDDGEPVCYDLCGRRVVNPSGGLYIVNGRLRVLR